MKPQLILTVIAMLMAAGSYVYPQLLGASVVLLGAAILTTHLAH
jgi:hypothetical protein